MKLQYFPPLISEIKFDWNISLNGGSLGEDNPPGPPPFSQSAPQQQSSYPFKSSPFEDDPLKDWNK